MAVASEVLGDKVIAVTGADASVPEREVKEASQSSAQTSEGLVCQ